jgi:hypothetical protein
LVATTKLFELSFLYLTKPVSRRLLTEILTETDLLTRQADLNLKKIDEMGIEPKKILVPFNQ